MSDTQGASDPGTATGGLENDMPGIGNAPASPRAVPSALGGLASFAQQILGIGGLAPRPPGPGRSPFQYPGQSQIPQQQQRPISPNAPRWQGTTASLFLPKGSEQPPARFSPFKGTLPRGDYRSWGQPEQFSELPRSFELPGLYKGLGQFFGQQGGLSGPLGLLIAGHADAYIKGVKEGQEFRAKMELENLKLRSRQLQDTLEQQHTRYADVMNEYFELAGEDKVKAGTVTIKGINLREALHQVATELNDPEMIHLIEGGASFDNIMRHQDYRDSRLKDLQKVNQKALDQEAEDNKEREDAGLPPKPSSQQQQPFGSPFTPSQPQQTSGGAQPPTPSGAPAPSMTPNQQGGPQATAPTDQATPIPPYQEDANEVFRGEKTLNSVPKSYRHDVDIAQAQKGAQIERIKNDFNSRKIADNQLPAELDKLIPGMGEDYTNTLNGAPSPTGAAGRSPYWQAIKNLIPGFNPTVQQATLRDFSSGGKSGTRLAAGARMGPAAKTVLEALKSIPENEPIPYYMADALIAGKWTGDAKYTGLFNALNTYIQDAQSLQSPTGRFFVTEVESIKKALQTTSGPQAIRTILQQDAENSTQLIDQLVRNYQRGSRQQGNPTTYDDTNVEILRSIVNLDPKTGFTNVPKEKLPPELQNIWPALGGQGGGGSSGSTIPKGWTVTPIQ